MVSIPIDQILSLPVSDRLRLLEVIWDSIAANPDEVPFPDWHRDELDRRLNAPASGPGQTWEEVQAKLKPSK